MSKLDELVKEWRDQAQACQAQKALWQGASEYRNLVSLNDGRISAFEQCASDLELALAARRERKPGKWRKIKKQRPPIGETVELKGKAMLVQSDDKRIVCWVGVPNGEDGFTHWREMPKGPEVKP